MRWGWSDLPGMYALPCVLAMPIDPGGTCASLPDGYTLLPATLKTVSASTCSTYEADTGFTLSHYGSHTSLPTLKPGLAAKAPRLCTDCLPGFVRAGVSPAYTAYTELAHLQHCLILHMGKRRIILPSVTSIVNTLNVRNHKVFRALRTKQSPQSGLKVNHSAESSSVPFQTK